MAHILKYFAVLLSFAVLSEAFTLDFDHMERAIREKRDISYTYPAPEQCGKQTPKTNQLCLYGPPQKPTQLAMVNTTSTTAIIMEARARQVVFVGKNYTIILDGIRSKGSYTANTPPVDSESIQGFASGYNISLNYCLNEHNAVDLKDFGPKKAGNSIVMGVVNAFRNLINERMKFLIPIFTFVTKGWLLLNGGALDIFTIIKGIADFVSKMPYKTLITLAIIIPLTVLVIYHSGLFSFVVILYEMAKKVLLQDILGWLITKVISVFEYLGGMGGWSLSGVGGVFTILYKIIEILFSDNISNVIGSGVRFITELVLKFFGIKTEEGNKEPKVNDDFQFLLDLFNENAKKDPTKSIKSLIDFALGMLGKMLITVKGINIGDFVNILCNPSIENGLEMAGKIIKLFTPLNLNNIIKEALAGLFKGAMHLLAADDVDPAYVQTILPGISLPPGTTLQTHNDTRALLRLPTQEIIRRIPRLHAISNALDKTALENYNTTLSKEMKKDRNFDREIRLAIRAYLT